MQPSDSVPAAPRKKGFKLTDLLIFLVTLVIIIVLLRLLLGFIGLKQDVSHAQHVSDAFISDLRANNVSAAYKLADSSFQQTTSAAQLSAVFKASAPFVKPSPTIVHTALENASNGKDVTLIYKFSGSPKSFYLRIVVNEPKKSKTWQLIDLAGNQTESSLL